ncbi:hypothetical protein [Streptomyces sp. NPDC048191]|uniref:hypothetical protein n=1 Tax=Streptomyces sp. NPDC048191 TaxID=3155484 RepID=UPI0033CB919D
MTPWLRITLRCTGPLLALAAALPAYGAIPRQTPPAYGNIPGQTTPAYGTIPGHPKPSYTAEPGPGGSTGAGRPHRSVPPIGGGGPYRPVPPEHTPLERPHEPGSGPADSAGHDQGPGPGRTGSPLAEPAPIPMPSDSASASYRPPGAVAPTRAGSPAGEGRMRPGRPDGPAAEVEGDDYPVPTRTPASGRPEEPETADLPTLTPPPSNVPDEAGLNQPPAQNPASQGQTAPAPVLQILPLGSGLVLIGLGLALAFLGLRLRRD